MQTQEASLLLSCDLHFQQTQEPSWAVGPSQLWKEISLHPLSPSAASLEDVGHLQFNKSLSSLTQGRLGSAIQSCLHQTMPEELQKACHVWVCEEQEKTKRARQLS